MNLTTPTIHLNGTSRESLMDSLMNAGAAIKKAIRALQEAAPHGRDYYPQGPDVYRKAVAEYEERIDKLTSVVQDISIMLEAIDAAPGQGRPARG